MKYLPGFLISGALALSFACTEAPESVPPSSNDFLGPGEVALVNGDRIPESIFRLFTLNALQTDADNLTPEGRAEVIDRLVTIELLANEAEQNGLPEERRIAAALELQRLQVLARSMTERFTDENPPTEAELRDLYEENLPRLRSTEYKTRHILVDTQSEATSLIQQLDAGADFAQLAREHSTDTASAEDGGDLGWASADNWVQPFAEAVRSATPGVHVPSPVESQYGWHVILVDEVAEQVAPGLEAVRQDLIVAAEARKLNDFINELRDAAEVTIP